MKISLTVLIALIGLTDLVKAQELPTEAKAIIDKLNEYEKRELKKTEEEILKKKKGVLKSIERSEKRIKTDGMRKLYLWQIKKLQGEIKNSERAIKGGDLSADNNKPSKDIVHFDQIYYYKHPMEAFADQLGELIFYQNRTVRLNHRNTQGKSLFQHVVKWDIRDGKMIIIDEIHGDMIVRQTKRRKRSRLSIEWTRLGKTINARTRKGN